MSPSRPVSFFMAAAFAAAVLLSGCAATGDDAYINGTPVNLMPMYGQPDIQLSERIKQANETFIERVTKIAGTREEASITFWLEGNEYMREDNLNFAMRRYNQSWLLNPNYYGAYWGFARVLAAQKQYDEAMKYFDKALQLIGDEPRKAALLADAAKAWRVWATSLYFQKRYADAWETVHAARLHGVEFSEAFIQGLEEKRPEPK